MLKPSKTGDLLQSWSRDLRTVVEKYGGLIHQAVGDGIVASWKEGSTSPGDVIAVLRALQEYQRDSAAPFRFVLHFDETADQNNDDLSGNGVDFVFQAEKAAKRFGVTAMLSEAAVTSLGLGAQDPTDVLPAADANR